MTPESCIFGVLAGLAAFLTGCVSVSDTGAPNASKTAALCSWGGVEIYTDFDAARVDRCEAGPDGFLLTILPEADPINPSPWYAFRMVAASPQSIDVTLHYPEFKHRYPPKISHDGAQWTRLPDDQISIGPRLDRASFSISVTPEPIYISAQELMANDAYEHWIADTLSAFPYLQNSKIGTSSQGRYISRIESEAKPENSSGTIMLVGRQHPPEVSGVFALFAFVEETFGESVLATNFRECFSIVVIPALNPDGVAMGNWRMNAGNVDLNRDWGPFSQPETQLMRDELIRIDDRDRLALFLDFHSTSKNVIYTQTDDSTTVPRDFAARWHLAMSEADHQFGLVRQAGDDTDRTTSKAYVYNTYGSAAITFEMHDEEDRQVIGSFSSMAAREMMKILLADSECNSPAG